MPATENSDWILVSAEIKNPKTLEMLTGLARMELDYDNQEPDAQNAIMRAMKLAYIAGAHYGRE